MREIEYYHHILLSITSHFFPCNQSRRFLYLHFVQGFLAGRYFLLHLELPKSMGEKKYAYKKLEKEYLIIIHFQPVDR